MDQQAKDIALTELRRDGKAGVRKKRKKDHLESTMPAAIWNAPVVFIITNNLYGEYSPIRSTTPLDDLARRADP